MKAEEFGLELGAEGAGRLLLDLKDREARGYLRGRRRLPELLMRRADGWRQPFFEIDSYWVHVEERVGDDEPPLAEATVKVVTMGTRHIESAEGQGPVGALDNALRKALANDYLELQRISLEDFRVRARRDDRDGRRGARPDRHVERPAGVDHGRRLREHHRGIVEALVDGYLFGLLHPRDDDEVSSPPAVP